MPSENLQSNTDNPEPFIIWKNARKEIKKQERRRKQSYQHPVTTKKQRKMTIEVSRARFEVEDLPSFKSFGSEPAIEEEEHASDFKQLIGNISEEEESVHHHSSDLVQKEEQVELNLAPESLHQNEAHLEEMEENIPFNCNEWELDRESPYLKNFNTMRNEMDELRLDA